MNNATMLLNRIPDGCEKCPVNQYTPPRDGNSAQRLCYASEEIANSLAPVEVENPYTHVNRPFWCPLRET